MSILTTRMIASLNLASTLWERIDVSINRMVLVLCLAVLVVAGSLQMLAWEICKKYKSEKWMLPLQVLTACLAAWGTKVGCDVSLIRNESGITIAVLVFIVCLIPRLISVLRKQLKKVK